MKVGREGEALKRLRKQIGLGRSIFGATKIDLTNNIK